jgi:hypothetical protein
MTNLLNAFVYPIHLHKLFAFSLGLVLSFDLETNIPGLGIGLVTETRRFKVFVSVSALTLTLQVS